MCTSYSIYVINYSKCVIKCRYIYLTKLVTPPPLLGTGHMYTVPSVPCHMTHVYASFQYDTVEGPSPLPH